MANILEQLSDEHEEVTKLLETLSADEGDRIATFEELFRNLLAHTKAEEQEFYSQVRTLDEQIEEKIEDSFQEHQEVEKLLRRARKLLGDDERFFDTLEELKDNVEHHVEEEEGELFPLVERYLSEEELSDLADEFTRARKAVVESIAPNGDIGDEYSEMTKEELYEAARSMDVEGRSKMTRDEIEDELRKK